MLFGSLSLEYWKEPILLKPFSPASAMIFWELEFEFKGVRQQRGYQRRDNSDQHLCALVRTAGGWDLGAREA